jgi:hypothetical protein
MCHHVQPSEPLHKLVASEQGHWIKIHCRLSAAPELELSYALAAMITTARNSS